MRGSAWSFIALLYFVGVSVINKSERDLISKYLYFAEERFIEAVKLTEYRYTRRELDSIDLLEEIIAKERLQAFQDIKFDIVRLLKLDKSVAELNQHIKLYNEDNESSDLEKAKYSELMKMIK